jgi:hypothetical protein
MKFLYQKNVFINCPFDKEYSDIFYAIIFTIIDCGFTPRCALEIEDGTESRLKKILKLIKECQLGIHDISRTKLDKKHQLPRFNMPFELGLFLGARHFGGKHHYNKNCLILDSKPYRFQKFLSDIAGHDIKVHKNRGRDAMNSARQWLQLQIAKNIILPTGQSLFVRYQKFQGNSKWLCKELKLSTTDMLFREYHYMVSEWIKRNPLCLK